MDVLQLARILWAAASGGPRPSPELAQGLDEAGAYAVQDGFAGLMRQEGSGMAGYKIALTSAEAQERFGGAGPVYGQIPGCRCFENGARLTIPPDTEIRVECELALVLSRDVRGPLHGRAEALDCVAYGLPALELVSGRYSRPHTHRSCLIADNASLFAVVLGDVPVPLGGLDTSLLGLRLEVDGTFRLSGVSAAVMGDPLHALDWLARTLCARGKGLRKGDIVLTGAFAPAVPAIPGMQFRADLDGLGSVSMGL